MTRAELEQMGLFLAKKQGIGDLTDTDLFTVGQALTVAHNQYALETKCYRSELQTVAATEDQAVYAFSDFGASGAGGRIFEPTYVSFNEIELSEVTESHLRARHSDFRTAASGTPEEWCRWGDRRIRLICPPATDDDIGLEGFEIADPDDFADPSDEPDVHELDQPLLAVYTAILLIVGDPLDQDKIRSNMLYPTWKNGTRAAHARIHSTGRADVVAGRYKSIGAQAHLSSEGLAYY